MIVLLAQVAAAVAGIPLAGTVRDAIGRQPIAAVTVTVDSTATPLAASTDAEGRYHLALPGPGTWTLHLARAGFTERRVAVTVDRRAPADTMPLVLDVALAPDPVQLAPVSVATAPPPRAWMGPEPASRAELGVFTVPAGIRNGAWRELGEAVSSVPGVTSRSALNWQPHVHGGDAAQTAVRLDDFPIYNASHFGAASSAANPDALGLTRVRTGVLPASSGDRLSGAVDLSSARAEPGITWTGALGSADVRAVFALAPRTVPWQILASARSSYRSILNGGLGAEEDRNGYSDLFGTFHTRLADGTFELLGFRSDNHLGFPTKADSLGGLGSSSAGAPAGNTVIWTSRTYGAGWTGNADHPWHPAFRLWTARAATAAQWGDVADTLDARYDELGLSADVTRTTEQTTWQLGVELRRTASRYLASTGPLPSDSEITGDPSPLRLDTGLWTAIPYVAVERTFGPWTLAAGLRGLGDAHGLTASPRLSARWQATDRLTFAAAAGRTVQTEQSLWNEEALGGALLGVEVPVAGLPDIPRASSRDALLSGTLLVGDHATLSAVGYTRRLNGLALVAPTTTAWFATTLPIRGSGSAQGVAASLGWHDRRFDATLGLGLERSLREVAGTVYRPSAQPGQLFTLHLMARPSSNFAAWLSTGATREQWASRAIGPLDWSPFAGLINTGELSGDAQNADPTAPYDRLPATFDVTVGLRRDWHVSAAHTRGTLSLTFGATNLLGRRNPVAFATDGIAGHTIPLAGQPRGLFGELAWHF